MLYSFDEIELTKNYEKNMALFEKYCNLLHAKLVYEKDDSYSLELTKNSINISKDGSSIYPTDSILPYHKELIDAYNKRDKLNLVEYDVDAPMLDKSVERFGTESLAGKCESDQTKEYVKIFRKMPDLSRLDPYHDDRYAMVIFGIGLGYQIPDLVSTHNVQQLILIDVNIEMLRASLYTLDWGGIFSYFTEENKFRSIEFIIEKKAIDIEVSIAKYFYETLPFAYYNLAQFVTYDNDILKDSIYRITKQIKSYTGSSQGFYDDEKWSLQHTLHNIKEEIPLLVRRLRKVPKDAQVFLIANGPSLDLYIDYIKENRDKAIIIAAGSSLSSLYKNDIKPDFYVDMERTITTYRAIKSFAPKEWLKDIVFIAMNTIHPRVFTLFDKSYMFLKQNDCGAKFLLGDSKKYPMLSYTNPTVSNTALRVALYFGFHNISFFGMDFGYKSLDNHHSKSSMYYDKDSEFYTEKVTEKIEVPGIDGGIVYTETFYNNSRLNIEVLTKECKEDYPDKKIYNYSEGAYIDSVIYANHKSGFLDTVSPLTKENKQEIMDTIDNFFVFVEERKEVDVENVNEHIAVIQRTIVACKLDNIDAFTYLKFTRLILMVVKNRFQNEPYMLQIVKGTLFTLMSKTYLYVSFQKQDENTTKFIHNSMDLIVKYLEGIQHDMSHMEDHIDAPN